MSQPARTVEPSDHQQAFVASLPVLDRIVALLARRNGLSPADAEDFASWVKARIVESDYEVFRSFGGRSSLSTYLTVVLQRLLCDYRNARWGRWRPSAAALRAGSVAIRLEELLHRDGRTLREATQVLRAAGLAESDGEVARLAARLPMRQSRDEISLASVPSDAAVLVADPVATSDDVAAARALEQAIEETVGELPAEDALIVRMRFWSDMSVADVARALRLEQKPLYRRLEALHARLRARLAARGFDREAAGALLDGDPVS